jgi:hypothetical protein
MTALNAQMMLEGVTPGPWKLELSDPPCIVDDDGELVVDLPMWQPAFRAERDANARLIAEAPRLARRVIELETALAVTEQAMGPLGHYYEINDQRDGNLEVPVRELGAVLRATRIARAALKGEGDE